MYRYVLYTSEILNTCSHIVSSIRSFPMKAPGRCEEDMIWQQTPYTVPLLVVSALSIVLAGYIWFHYRSPLGRTGAVTILASTEWIIMSTLKMAGGDLATKVFWRNMQYLGIAVLPVAWFAFAVLYTGREHWLNRRILTGLSVIPAITLGLVFTNEYHGLVWSEFTLDATGPFLTMKETYGVWLWAFIGYAYALLLSGVLLFFIQIVTCSRTRYRQQTSILLIGAMIPWVASALASLGLNPLLHFDLTLGALTMTNIIVAFNILYFRLGDVIPLAQEVIIESMNDSVFILDMENRIVDVNPSAQQLMGVENCIGKYITEVWPEASVLHINAGKGAEIVLDHDCIYDVSISPLVDWRDRIVSRVVVLRDVTDRKRSEKIKQSLKEKEILLQEIHHRVKNNIQIISSLLNLQAHYSNDKKYAEMLKESQNRIKSMGLIHEKLYQSENLADIDFKEYITDLVYTLFRSYGVSGVGVTIESDVTLGITTAIPCGLIINELVSNAVKYAFPDGTGEITIRICSVNGDIELIVADNGVGIPEDMDFKNAETLGLRLVSMLAEDQLNGEIDLDRSEGTRFRITFTAP